MHVRHSVADEPEQVKQLEWQLEHWNSVSLLLELHELQPEGHL